MTYSCAWLWLVHMCRPYISRLYISSLRTLCTKSLYIASAHIEEHSLGAHSTSDTTNFRNRQHTRSTHISLSVRDALSQLIPVYTQLTLRTYNSLSQLILRAWHTLGTHPSVHTTPLSWTHNSPLYIESAIYKCGLIFAEHTAHSHNSPSARDTRLELIPVYTQLTLRTQLPLLYIESTIYRRRLIFPEPNPVPLILLYRRR